METRDFILAILLAGLPGVITLVGNIYGIFSARTAKKADVAERIVGASLKMFNELQEEYAGLKIEFAEMKADYGQLRIEFDQLDSKYQRLLGRFELLRRGNNANIEKMKRHKIDPVYIPPPDWEEGE